MALDAPRTSDTPPPPVDLSDDREALTYLADSCLRGGFKQVRVPQLEFPPRMIAWDKERQGVRLTMQVRAKDDDKWVTATDNDGNQESVMRVADLPATRPDDIAAEVRTRVAALKP